MSQIANDNFTDELDQDDKFEKIAKTCPWRKLVKRPYEDLICMAQSEIASHERCQHHKCGVWHFITMLRDSNK